MPGDAPWRAQPGALLVSVRLTPRGGRDAIDGVEALADGRTVLKARVRVAPEDGKANAALLRLVAAACGVPAARVTLAAGAGSRMKTLRIEAEPAALAASLSAQLPARPEADDPRSTP